MNDDEENNSPANLSDFFGGLQKAKDEIPKSDALLKDKPKSSENYLILKNGVVVETDQTGLKDGWTIVKE
ncbi:MAG: hypothetical protein NTW79_03235 [Candidatus Berkelbacteria bacterium]|nr:hypothetical protein [Candidatus Berkelbacteria bacterium]